MVPLVENSKWVEYQASSGKVFKLVSCPSGYRVVSQDGEFDLQRCEPCPSGEDCVAASCVNATCTPCKAGTYKDSAGVQACRACPPGTFNPDSKSMAFANCKPCPTGADTGGVGGQTSASACKCAPSFYLSDTGGADSSIACERCPEGARCSSGECALRSAAHNCTDGKVPGRWERVRSGENAGKFWLVGCPSGFSTSNSSHDTQVPLPTAPLRRSALLILTFSLSPPGPLSDVSEMLSVGVYHRPRCR